MFVASLRFGDCNICLVADANVNELKLILGLQSETAENIIRATNQARNNNKEINSIKDYKEFLDRKDYNELKKRLEKLSPFQRKYLSKPKSEKKLDLASLLFMKEET